MAALLLVSLGAIILTANAQMDLVFDDRLAVATALMETHPLAGFNPVHHSGPASPYFRAPSQAGLSYDTPEGCVVDQAAYFVRHGTRYPEPGSFAGWESLFAKFQNTSYTAWGPLSFISSWVPPVDDVSHESLFLTSTGAGESFALGVNLRQRYGLTPGGSNFTVWAANQQRVVDTATYFVRGYLSQGNYINNTNLNRGTVITLPDSAVNTTFADSVTPSSSCPAYGPPSQLGSTNSNLWRSTFQNRTAARLNTFLDGLVLNATDIGVMQDLCGFEFSINGDTTWCKVFEPEEWRDYEYAADLNYYWGSGPGNPLSATNGWPWVKAISDLFVVGPGKTVANGTLTPPPLIVAMTHDNNMPPVLAALGLWNSTTTFPGETETNYPLPVTRRITDPTRFFHSTYLVSFLGHIALERMTCTIDGTTLQQRQQQGIVHKANIFGGTFNITNSKAFQGTNHTFVRVRVNDAPFPFPVCDSGPGSSCPLENFTSLVNGQMKEVCGDFVERCGLQGVKGATSVMSFLTTAGDGESQLIGVEGTPKGPASPDSP